MLETLVNMDYDYDYLDSPYYNVYYDSNGNPLLEACFNGNLDKIREMGTRYLKNRDELGNTALHKAVQGNRPQVLLYLLRQKVDINGTNNNRETALHIAVRDWTSPECTEILLQHKCDVNIKNATGQTALMIALSQSDIEDCVMRKKKDKLMNKLIGASNLNYTVNDIRTYFEVAVIHGNVFVVKKFIDKIPKLLSSFQENGNKAIHFAAINGQNKVIEILLKRKVNVDSKGYHSITALHYAADFCKLSTIEYLVAKKANCNSVDEDGNTPLHTILGHCFVCCVHTKCKYVNIINDCEVIRCIYKKLPEQFKNKCVLIAVAEYLIVDGKSDVFVKNKNKKTPLEMISKDNKDSTALTSYLKDVFRGVDRGESIKKEKKSLQQRRNKISEELLKAKENEKERLKREIELLRKSTVEKNNEISSLKTLMEDIKQTK